VGRITEEERALVALGGTIEITCDCGRIFSMWEHHHHQCPCGMLWYHKLPSRELHEIMEKPAKHR
jgi:hypothetical protein